MLLFGLMLRLNVLHESHLIWALKFCCTKYLLFFVDEFILKTEFRTLFLHEVPGTYIVAMSSPPQCPFF